MSVYSPIANRYREVAIKTANPVQLVVILYDGAIQALQEAQEFLKRRDIAGRARCINRAVAIISELQASLNFAVGGDIAASLERLYNYMKHRIFTANVDQNAEPLVEVSVLLGNLRSAWVKLAEETTIGVASPADQASPNPMALDGTTGGPSSPGSLNILG